jgi:hypothetical protein
VVGEVDEPLPLPGETVLDPFEWLLPQPASTATPMARTAVVLAERRMSVDITTSVDRLIVNHGTGRGAVQ